jgi:hypothetical protein
MKKLFSIALLGACVLAARAAGYDKQIDAALESAISSQVEIDSHRFSVTPPEMKDKSKHKYTLAGQLTLVVPKGASKEVIAYRAVREKGAVKSIELQVNDGMWLPISDTVMQALGGYTRGEPMPEEQQQKVTQDLEKLLNGTSRRAAEFLIARMTIKHC